MKTRILKMLLQIKKMSDAAKNMVMIITLIITLAFPGINIPVSANVNESAYAAGAVYDEALSNAGEAAADAENLSNARLVRGTIAVSDIDKYGNTYLSITCEDFFEAGYEYGDIVKVKILGKKFRLPFVSNYSDVDTGKTALLAREGITNISLAINMGDFATTYGLAAKTVFEDGSFEWNYPEGVSGPVKVSIWMKKKGGYADEYAVHKLTRSNERTDYPELTDEEFANFREVKTSGMGFGILYRTSSPINPEINRNTYADKALKDAGVTVVLNLSDTEEEIKEFEGFSETYYSSTKHKALAMNMDFQSSEFEQKLADGLRFMAENPGVYAVHCKEGKDRVGFVTAILECLMGAEYNEVADDYMVTYYNYYGVKLGDPAYEAIIKGNIEKTLKLAFTFKKKDGKKDLSTRNLSKCATKYLKKIGLTSTEIKKLKRNLSGKVSIIDKNVTVE